MRQNKGFVPIIIPVILLVVLAGVIYGGLKLTKNTKQKPTAKPNEAGQTTTASQTSTTTKQSQTPQKAIGTIKGWKTYTDTIHNVSFQYPDHLGQPTKDYNPDYNLNLQGKFNDLLVLSGNRYAKDPTYYIFTQLDVAVFTDYLTMMEKTLLSGISTSDLKQVPEIQQDIAKFEKIPDILNGKVDCKTILLESYNQCQIANFGSYKAVQIDSADPKKFGPGWGTFTRSEIVYINGVYVDFEFHFWVDTSKYMRSDLTPVSNEDPTNVPDVANHQFDLLKQIIETLQF